MKSKFLTLGLKDIFKGIVMAFLGAFCAGLLQLLDTGTIPTTWVQIQPIVITGVAAALAYIMKNLFTNSEDKILKSEVKLI